MTTLIMIIGFVSAAASLGALGVAGFHAVREETSRVIGRPKKEG